LSGRGNERDRLREEHAHRVPQRDRLLVRPALHAHALERRAGELDRGVQGESRELLALRLLHRLGLPLRELAEASHQILGVASEREAWSTFHVRPFLRSLHVMYAPMAAGRFAEALNEQIANEFAASQQYVAIAVYYDAETLTQLAAHFYRQAVEERNHAMMIVQYLLDADLPVTIPAVGAPQTTFADAVAPVRLALDQEKTVTGQISSLAALAREEGDLVGAQFLDWFLKEQREEVSSMSDLLAIVRRAADSNLLLAEEYLARVQVGDQGVDASAPEAAGGAL
jgi:bacterioferritin B